jgi:predicted nuclease of restriction endonuclease-like (RecB) superfamily
MKKLIDYQSFLTEVADMLKTARLQAVLAANKEMIHLYWQIGKMILNHQYQNGWGAKIIDQLAKDLRMQIPDIKGFSVRNLKYMRSFAEAYSDFAIVETVSAKLSWSHHILLLDKFDDPKLRYWYMLKSIEQGWSHRILIHQIELKAHNHIGNIQNNFPQTLPSFTSDLAKQMFKDEYVFDFISITDAANELSLERSLTQNITHLLLALGKGFAFIGRQQHLKVGAQDFYIDMLFYHVKLHCYIVIELKTDIFKPEYAGKLNFYLSAVDSLLKNKDDNPSIGLLLCKSKDDLVVEFALRDVSKPMGVATYQLTDELPENLKSALPSKEELDAIFKQLE